MVDKFFYFFDFLKVVFKWETVLRSFKIQILNLVLQQIDERFQSLKKYVICVSVNIKGKLMRVVLCSKRRLRPLSGYGEERLILESVTSSLYSTVTLHVILVV